MISLHHPFSEKQVRALKAGDAVSITGRIYTGRDKLHKFFSDGGRLPVDFKDGALYHCGPVVIEGGTRSEELGSKAGRCWKVMAAGPTTSVRENPYEPDFIAKSGVRLVIGKGGMDAATLRAMKKYGCVYIQAVGGAAALSAAAVKRVAGVSLLKEFGAAEAVWHFDVENFTGIVAMDAHGVSLFDKVAKTSAAACRRLFDGLKRLALAVVIGFSLSGMAVEPPTGVRPENVVEEEVTPRCFKDIADARKFYDAILKSNGKKWEGAVDLHGRRIKWFHRWKTGSVYNEDEGRTYTQFNWTQYSCNSVGSILAVPDSEFMVRDVFICDNGTTVSTGGVVSVGVTISGGGTKVSEAVKQQTIRNLALSGMPVRGDSGNPGGRLLPLKQSSRERFGASSSEVYLGFEPGQVYIVLYGCDLSKMKEYVTPLSMVGNKSNQHAGK